MVDTPVPVPRWPQDPFRFSRPEGTEDGRAITIAELVIIGAIVATLAGIGIPVYERYRNTADIAKAVVEIRTLEHEVYMYEGVNGRLPDLLEEVNPPNILDPWGSPYQFLNTTTKRGPAKARFDKFFKPLNTDFDLYSMGRDGETEDKLDRPTSLDDIVRALDGQFVDLASNYAD